MKVAVLYVCTGKYVRFWQDFFESAQQHFLPHVEKHFFVFTDQPLGNEVLPNVTRVQQANLGWPDNTLKRYHMFLEIQSQLAQYDYLYFFNANCQFQRTVGDEFLPDRPDQLVVVQHPGQVNIPIDRVPYERNPRSRACIPIGLGDYYVCGGVNGGGSRAFLQLAKTVAERVDQDCRDGVVATWHDESHLNRYILDHSHCLKHAGHCFPEGWKLGEPELIRIRNKNSISGGTQALRAPGEKQQSEDMVSVAIYGGLGNQMFQYAVGRALAHRLGCRLQLDTRHYDQHRSFRYGLGDFNINAVIGTSRTLPPDRQQRWKYLRWRYFSNKHRMIREQGLAFDPSILDLKGSIYMRGYWQSENYFAEIAKTIRNDLTHRDGPNGRNAEMMQEISSNARTIALHVRRGDYISNPSANQFHGTCPPQYYRQAVQWIAGRTSGQHTVYVFSDDAKWARHNIHCDFPMVFVDHNDGHSAHEDMRLMSACQHQVISNSTFSWWAAWLNIHPEKIVVAPHRWFAHAQTRQDDIVPASWYKLDWNCSSSPISRAA